MLTKITIRNFKLLDEVELELGERVVLIGPNNSGKTTALQAFALWEIGVKRWLEKRGAGPAPSKRPGVTINRRDLIAIPVPVANLLWRDLHVRRGIQANGKQRTENVLVEILVETTEWQCGLEFDYANAESFYCRPMRQTDGERMPVPNEAAGVNIAYLPPMSGLAANEVRLDRGAINVRLGEGRTAEVLRNLCFQVIEGENGPGRWTGIVQRMEKLFGIHLEQPQYIAERGEIVMDYRTHDGILLDLSASGRGQQQTLMLLAYMAANPGSILLLDEPDAHLEILRQRQIYQILSETAGETGGQIIAASHSEVVLNEAADRDILIAFVGKPHRIDDRGSQVAKSLKDIGFEHYLQAEEQGWILYLEGSTDLSILHQLAVQLEHPAAKLLEAPYVHYVGNQPRKAQEHFYGVREAKPDLAGIAIYDRLEREVPADPNLVQHTWHQRELENYICDKAAILGWVRNLAEREAEGPLFVEERYVTMAAAMEQSIAEIETAFSTLGKPSPWDGNTKATDDFLDPLFDRFFEKLKRPNLMRKTDYHDLVPFVTTNEIDVEVIEALDKIVQVAERANPRQE